MPSNPDQQVTAVAVSAEEQQSLNEALEAAAKTKQANPHIHAEAVNGQLKFSAEAAGRADPKEQVPDSASRVEINGKAASRTKMIASPAAIKVLNERAANK